MRDKGEQELLTATTMIHMYCWAHHNVARGAICLACSELEEYVKKRIVHCVYGADKPACNNCSIHCYTEERRKQIKIVMRYSAPRMMYKHPIMALRHVLKGKKK